MNSINRHLQKLTSNPCTAWVKTELLEKSNKIPSASIEGQIRGLPQFQLNRRLVTQQQTINAIEALIDRIAGGYRPTKQDKDVPGVKAHTLDLGLQGCLIVFRCMMAYEATLKRAIEKRGLTLVLFVGNIAIEIEN